MTLLSIPANPVPEGAIAGTIGTPDGARHATRTLIRHLTGLGVAVDLIGLIAVYQVVVQPGDRNRLGHVPVAGGEGERRFG